MTVRGYHRPIGNEFSTGSYAWTPTARVAAAEPGSARTRRAWAASGALCGLSGLFFWTLVSPAAKPEWARNAAPFLLAAGALAALGPAPAAPAAARANPRE